jgi:hypothetical protein
MGTGQLLAAPRLSLCNKPTIDPSLLTSQFSRKPSYSSCSFRTTRCTLVQKGAVPEFLVEYSDCFSRSVETHFAAMD